MTKQTFTIPDGCKAVTVEQVGNQIITTFEPSRQVFKRGDVCISFLGGVCIVDKIQGNFIYEIVGVLPRGTLSFSSRLHFTFADRSRHATPEEAQRLWDALAKDGKRWNPETMELEEIKKELWRADCQRFYFFIADHNFSVSECMETSHLADCMRYNSGNYFQTEEQAQRASNRIKAALSEFWKEELK